MSEMKWGMKPLEVNGKVHRFIMEYVKEEDPFKEEKERSNEMAMKLVEMFRTEILNSPDPVYSAAKLAVSGNLIDLGIPGWKTEDVFEKLHEAYERPSTGRISKSSETPSKVLPHSFISQITPERSFSISSSSRS